MKTIYNCIFEFSDKNFITTSSKGIGDFIQGFWIDGQGQLCKTSERKYFVPASRIKYIEKVEITDE